MESYGYMRVSNASQNEDRQIIVHKEIEVDKKNIYGIDFSLFICYYKSRKHKIHLQHIEQLAMRISDNHLNETLHNCAVCVNTSLKGCDPDGGLLFLLKNQQKLCINSGHIDFCSTGCPSFTGTACK